MRIPSILLVMLFALSCATTALKVYDDEGRTVGKFTRRHLLIKQSFKVDVKPSGELEIDVSTESGPGEKAMETMAKTLEKIALLQATVK